jgi:hypothetical protein
MRFCASLFALALALQNSANAQSSLEPCRQDFMDGYHIGVNKRIDAAVAHKPSLMLTTFPSFETESGLRLVGADIYLVEFQKQFWHESYVVDRKGAAHMNFTKPKGAVRTRHAALDASVAARVLDLYSNAIANATPTGRIGLDGTAYVFSTPGGACGWAWSPEPASRNGRLVELARLLEVHARLSNPIDLQRSEKAIVGYVNAVEGSGRQP